MLDTIIVLVIVAVAFAYVATTLYKKYKRLSSPNASACGGSCDNCPFSKASVKDDGPRSKGGGCGCGCGG